MFYPSSLTKGAVFFPQRVDSLSSSKAVVSVKTSKERTVSLFLAEVIKKI